MARRIWTRLAPLGALLLALQPVVQAKYQNDFSFYPAGAQACLKKASDGSNCNGDNVPDMNNCLCNNGGDFVINSAECIGKDDYADLDDVYTVMADACSNSGTPLSVSQRDFMLAGNGTLTSTTTSSSSSSTKTTDTKTTTKPTDDAKTSPTASGTGTGTSSGAAAQPTETDGKKSDGGGGAGDLPSGAKIGIIAGAAVAGVAIVAIAAVFILRYRRRKQATEESHPMLTPHSKYSSGFSTDPGSEWKWAGPDSIGDPKWQAANASPGTYLSEWSSPAQTPPAYHPAQMGVPTHIAPTGGVYELADQEPGRPIEMPAEPSTSAALGGGNAGGAYHSPGNQPWPPTTYGR